MKGVVVVMRPTTPPGTATFQSLPTSRRRWSLVVRRALLLEPGVADAGAGRSLAPAEVELVAAAAERRARLATGRAGASVASLPGSAAAPVPLRKTRRRLRFAFAAAGGPSVAGGRGPARRPLGRARWPSCGSGRVVSGIELRVAAPVRSSPGVTASSGGCGAGGWMALTIVTMRAISRAGSRKRSVVQARSCNQPSRMSWSGRRRSRSRVLCRAAYRGPSVSTASSPRPRW